uniref:Uncharacterized protein n=1 Tax=Haemonchus placei TaxID=6290 RepID=A0A0N4W209_HAEPC
MLACQLESLRRETLLGILETLGFPGAPVNMFDVLYSFQSADGIPPQTRQ